MKYVFFFFLLGVLSLHASESETAPKVSATPFEPPPHEFFDSQDKFAHPREVVAPRFLFPFELRRGGSALAPAEVVILVQLDGKGRAAKMKVLSSKHQAFTRSAIDALKKARWESTSEAWFYYRAVYTLDE